MYNTVIRKATMNVPSEKSRKTHKADYSVGALVLYNTIF